MKAIGTRWGRTLFARALLLFTLCLGVNTWMAPDAEAIPAFARKYEVSCTTCHAAFPRLNANGQAFVADNYRLSNWKEKGIVDTGDERLALPAVPPIAIRAQAFVQQRSGEEVDPATGPTGNDAKTDLQAPYLIKLISSAPLSDHITYYFYGIFAETGSNGETVIEDAWFQHDDAFGTGIAALLGQFQISDLMFPREQRLTFQDFMIYRMAGLTYDRGVLFGRDVGAVALNLGVTNGNGIHENFPVNSPGYRRPDAMFDNDTGKAVFGRIGLETGPARIGLFGYSGMQRNAAGELGSEPGDRDTPKQAAGLDLGGNAGADLYWFFQAIQNRWEGFLASGRDYEWGGGFAGMDWIASEEWVFSFLYNYTDAGDFRGTGTVYEGINMNSITLGASYYFMRNVKGVIEANYDLLKQDDDADFVGHESQEHYLLFGFDAAF